MTAGALPAKGRPQGAFQPLLEIAARKLKAAAHDPWRFAMSGYLAGVTFGFTALAAAGLKIWLGEAGSGWARLGVSVLLSAGLTALIDIAGFELAVGTAAVLAVCSLEQRAKRRHCGAAIAAAGAANLFGAATVAVIAAQAGVVESLRPVFEGWANARMPLTDGQVLLQGVLGGWWLGLIVLFASSAPSPGRRLAVTAWGLMLFSAAGFRLAPAEASMIVPSWLVGWGPEGGHGVPLWDLVWVTAGNLAGATTLAGGLVWLAKRDPRPRHTRTATAEASAPRCAATARMHPAIATLSGSVQIPPPCSAPPPGAAAGAPPSDVGP